MNEDALFHLAVSLARDRKIEQDREWSKERNSYLNELVEQRMEIRRAILLPKQTWKK